MKRVRIGNGCGFWGDNLDAPLELAECGRLDYLTLEYLAELTMSILALQKQRKPDAGYATDFLDVLQRLGPILKSQPRLDALLAGGHALSHMDSGAPLASVRERVVSANAYLGARPVVEALRRGA